MTSGCTSYSQLPARPARRAPSLSSLPRGTGRPISRGRRWERRMAPSAVPAASPAAAAPPAIAGLGRRCAVTAMPLSDFVRCCVVAMASGERVTDLLGLLASLGQLVGQAAELLSGLLDLLGHRLQAQPLARDGDAEPRAAGTEHALAEDHAADEAGRRGATRDDRRRRLLSG